ncbi:Protein hgh1 [Coemansia sp. RSA 989]|nr:putative HMG1/2-related protein [Coemansia mojavensis]KAJ1738248.1 Protein hgh1 [Coemansia sp. RSA 1086]KAJ1746810.1 Protein hgh1 [Coemansia sp. RSA 1821]KAJ1860813.1 Protein hgh1 [Coemansia sp. RSA 989]KAJ1868943.1 Protein hgh1 [Coemansia sp. RSA 990]KAJ2645814.1 Protein hgh1 [Coemansia sp. RSA 1250]KAJ2667631.1 Protein hgh1 [Coemansia sp. RSA 1085]
MEVQLDELVDFLSSPRPDVRQLAATYLVDFSKPRSDSFYLLLKRIDKLIQPLLAICHEVPTVANKAMSTLVNLSTDPSVSRRFADEDLLTMIVRMITSSDCYISDPSCMLLSNLTKNDNVCRILCSLEVNEVPGICSSTRAIDQLTDVFVKGMERKYNKNATYNFLASVFADVTNYPFGRAYFLERTSYDGKLPITKIMVFSEYPELIRRGGVDSTMKNVCFDKEKHKEILDPEETNMLPYILLPLCGPEEFEMEDMEKMPEEIQFLEDDKKREPDPKLRAALLEAINLLCTTFHGREVLRAKNVYYVLREMHKAETDEACIELNERAVQFIQGYESKETREDAPNAANDDAFEEI